MCTELLYSFLTLLASAQDDLGHSGHIWFRSPYHMVDSYGEGWEANY